MTGDGNDNCPSDRSVEALKSMPLSFFLGDMSPSSLSLPLNVRLWTRGVHASACPSISIPSGTIRAELFKFEA